MSQYEYWLGRATAVYITVLLQRQQVCSSEKLGQCKHFGQAGAIPLVELALYKQFLMYTVTRFMPKKRNTQYLRCLRPNSQNVPLANLSHHCWRMRRCKTTFFLRLLIVTRSFCGRRRRTRVGITAFLIAALQLTETR